MVWMLLRKLHELAPLRPGVEPIRIIQDKTLQKKWLADARLSRWSISRGAQRGRIAGSGCCAWGARVSEDRARRLRWPRAGAHRHSDAPSSKDNLAAWHRLGESARSRRTGSRTRFRDQCHGGAQPAGEVRSFPAARNHHENQILAWSVLPAGVPAEIGIAGAGVARR